MQVSDFVAARDKAIVELEERKTVKATDAGLLVYHDNNGRAYQPSEDFEVGTVLSLGEGDWEPLRVGDRVMVRGESGGKAGADIGGSFGLKANEVVVVSSAEVMCVLGAEA